MKNLTSLSIILFCISCSSTFYTVKTKNYEIEISGKGGGVKSFTKYLHGETVAELTGSQIPDSSKNFLDANKKKIYVVHFVTSDSSESTKLIDSFTKSSNLILSKLIGASLQAQNNNQQAIPPVSANKDKDVS